MDNGGWQLEVDGFGCWPVYLNYMAVSNEDKARVKETTKPFNPRL